MGVREREREGEREWVRERERERVSEREGEKSRGNQLIGRLINLYAHPSKL
jgi:hypothetical protein